MNNKNNINKIKLLRSYTKLSQNEFSSILGIPVTTYRKWEQGKRVPPDYLVIFIIHELEHMNLVGNGYDIIPYYNHRNQYIFCEHAEDRSFAYLEYSGSIVKIDISEYTIVKERSLYKAVRSLILQKMRDEIESIEFRDEVTRRFGKDVIFVEA